MEKDRAGNLNGRFSKKEADMTALMTIGGVDLTMHDMMVYLKISGKMNAVRKEMAMRQTVRNYFAENDREISTEDLQAACDEFRSQAGLYEASETMAWLTSMGLSADDFETYVETNKMIEILKEELAPPEKIRAYFEAHKEDYDKFIIHHIVTAREGEASLILSEIQDEGEDFARMARAHSINKLTAQAGGFIGPVRRTVLAELEDPRVFEAGPGELAGPIKSKSGFQILKIDEKIAADDLTETISAEIADKLFKNWVAARQ